MFTLRESSLRCGEYLENFAVATQEIYNSKEAMQFRKIVWLPHFLDYFDLVCTRDDTSFIDPVSRSYNPDFLMEQFHLLSFIHVCSMTLVTYFRVTDDHHVLRHSSHG